MAKKEITRETIEKNVKEFEAKGKINNTTLSIAWMDAYVAMIRPDTMDTYIEKCLSIGKKMRKDGKEVKDVAAIREYFIPTYFPAYTDDAIKAAKAQKKAEAAAKKAEKERFEKMTDEEKFRYKMEQLSKK